MRGRRPIAWALASLVGLVGLLPPASAQRAVSLVTIAREASYQGLWWNAPANSEPYWGINFAHQDDQVFGTWYTYDTTGRPGWLSTLATRTSPASNVYSGPIYVDIGPPFNNFVGTGKPTQIGTATLTFSDANNGTFAYTVNATSQLKSITRFDLGTGPQPTCTYSTTAPDYAAATNYQDLWWMADGSESGWGVNFAHQGDSVFATWYTYDVDGAPLWLSVLAPRVGTSNVYAGTLYRTSGPRFDTYDPAKAVVAVVGTATLTFKDGSSATFNYTTNGNGGLPAGVNQTKAIARYQFGQGGTVCSGPAPASVTVQSPTPSPWVGESMLLTAVARDASGAVIPGTTATWSSSDSGIATVASGGVLQGIAPGTVVVTATIDGVSGTQSLTITPMPRISVSIGATKEVVFAYKTDHCLASDLDFPDLPTHIVRAEDGSLVLFASAAPRYYVSRGADFNSLRRDCSQPVLVSADLPTPQSYENREWISAVYREGNRWHALISNEYHDLVASTCRSSDPSIYIDCLYLSATYGVSTDGARTFTKPSPPAHVVLPPPYVWEPPLPGAPPNWEWGFHEGYNAPYSLVRQDDGYFYAIVGLTPSKSLPNSRQCLLRADRLDDPASWRAWDGAKFNDRITSPYVTGNPASLCTETPDLPGGQLTFNTYLGRFMNLDPWNPVVDGKMYCSFAFRLSADLLHWSSPQLITEPGDAGFCPPDSQGSTYPAMYPTLIDHADTTINFERPGRTPYLYYARFNDSWKDRDLVRVLLTFTRID